MTRLINTLLNPIPIEAHGIPFYKELCVFNASDILSKGISINIFPEGVYISDKDKIYRGRTGAVRMLFNAFTNNPSINLVPISIKYNNKIENVDSYNFDYNNIDIFVLKPIDFYKFYEMYMSTDSYDIKNFCLHSVTDRAMLSIAESLNQEYSKDYFELDKKNMILPSGNTISDNECANPYIKCLYKNIIDENTKCLCKRLGR